MRVGLSFVLIIGALVAMACSSFSSEAVTDADAGVTDAASGTDAPGADAGPTPVVRWSFEGTGSSRSGAIGETFLLHDATFAPGVAGQALHCASGQYAETVPTGKPFQIGSGDATFVVWVSLDAADASADPFHTFFDLHLNWATSNAVGPGYGIGYVATKDPYIQAAVGDGTSSGPTFVRGKMDLGHDTFHMIALVVDATTLVLYGDQRVIGTAPLARTVPIAAGDAGTLRLCDIFSNYLRGSLDELMIFDRALTAPELAIVESSRGP